MLDLIAYMAGVTGLLSLIGVALLVMVDEKRAQRARAERECIASLKKADAEVSQRPHLRYPSPLPTIKGTST